MPFGIKKIMRPGVQSAILTANSHTALAQEGKAFIRELRKLAQGCIVEGNALAPSIRDFIKKIDLILDNTATTEKKAIELLEEGIELIQQVKTQVSTAKPLISTMLDQMFEKYIFVVDAAAQGCEQLVLSMQKLSGKVNCAVEDVSGTLQKAQVTLVTFNESLGKFTQAIDRTADGITGATGKAAQALHSTDLFIMTARKLLIGAAVGGAVAGTFIGATYFSKLTSIGATYFERIPPLTKADETSLFMAGATIGAGIGSLAQYLSPSI